MAKEAKSTADAGAYDFSGRYRFSGASIDAGKHTLAEMAERVCNGQPEVLAFMVKNWRPSASAVAVYAEYLLTEGTLGEHRRLLELLHRHVSPPLDTRGGLSGR